jgi:quinol monooxygenase YgiN
MGMTASYTGHVRCVAITVAKPGCEAPLRAALEALVPATQAEAGYIRYELHQDLDEPRRFIILEEWRDRASFDAHVTAPHTLRYGEQAGDWIEFATFHPMAPVADPVAG